jgi:hypothetical protein
MRALLLSVLGALWLATSACTDEPDSKTASVGKDKLCALAGAQFDAASDSCSCPNSGIWNGHACDAAPAEGATQLAAKAPVEAIATPVAAEEHQPAVSAETPTVEAPGDESGRAEKDRKNNAATPELSAQVKRDCKRAHGEWLEGESYCFCRRGGVLVGATCRQLGGRMTPEVCKETQAPGRWRDGRCECAPGLVFSPNRGGCQPPLHGSIASLRRICEGSLNNGRWNAALGACICPLGRVNVGEGCEIQERLSSREVCESATNRGQWDKDAKRCNCTAGHFWIDQQCKPFANVTASEACESEANHGRWESSLLKCICPRLTQWDAGRRSCI